MSGAFSKAAFRTLQTKCSIAEHVSKLSSSTLQHSSKEDGEGVLFNDVLINNWRDCEIDII